MSKRRLWTIGIALGLCYVAVDGAYGMGLIEGRTHKASPSAKADPSPVEVDGEDTDTAPESDKDNGE